MQVHKVGGSDEAATLCIAVTAAAVNKAPEVAAEILYCRCCYNAWHCCLPFCNNPANCMQHHPRLFECSPQNANTAPPDQPWAAARAILMVKSVNMQRALRRPAAAHMHVCFTPFNCVPAPLTHTTPADALQPEPGWPAPSPCPIHLIRCLPSWPLMLVTVARQRRKLWRWSAQMG